MKTEVRVAPQVMEFVRSRAPEPRQALRHGIRNLAHDKGDTKALEGKLAGWCRLRVLSYRVLFKESIEGGARVINCVFANHRSVVYEMFERLLLDELAGNSLSPKKS